MSSDFNRKLLQQPPSPPTPLKPTDGAMSKHTEKALLAVERTDSQVYVERYPKLLEHIASAVSWEQHLFFSQPVWPRYEKKPKRKRRREHPDSELPASLPSHSTNNPGSPPPSSPPPIALTSPDEQPQHENGPGSDLDSVSDSDVDPEARRYGPHLKHYVKTLINNNIPQLPREQNSLRMRHLAVMTTTLHRSLMEGDFARASRAYGLLIRSSDGDLRTMWGIGLEILLHRPEFDIAVEGEEELPRGGEGEGEREGGEYQPPARSQGGAGSTPEGVAKAIEYLRRLILLHPYHRQLHIHHPAIVAATKSSSTNKLRYRLKPSVLEFYPAFFNLLIKYSPYSSDPKPSGRNPMLDRNPELHPEKIKEQLESLMMTPPWSDILSLWLLRGMVCNWIADLESADISKRRRMTAEAKMCFDKVREKGVDLPEGVEREDEDDEEDQEHGDVDMASEDE